MLNRWFKLNHLDWNLISKLVVTPNISFKSDQLLLDDYQVYYSVVFEKTQKKTDCSSVEKTKFGYSEKATKFEKNIST